MLRNSNLIKQRLLFMLLFVLVGLMSASTCLAAGTITISSPNGGNYLVGEYLEITWTYANLPPDSTVPIYLCRAGNMGTSYSYGISGGIAVAEISAGVQIGFAGTGHIRWKIPSGLTTASDYYVQIYLPDYSGQGQYYSGQGQYYAGQGQYGQYGQQGAVSSAYFQISKGTIQITSPTSIMAPVTSGDTVVVAWRYNGLFDLSASSDIITIPPDSMESTIKVELLANGVSSGILHANCPVGELGSGVFRWTIGDLPNDNNVKYQIKVTSNADSTISATSEAFYINGSPYYGPGNITVVHAPTPVIPGPGFGIGFTPGFGSGYNTMFQPNLFAMSALRPTFAPSLNFNFTPKFTPLPAISSSMFPMSTSMFPMSTSMFSKSTSMFSKSTSMFQMLTPTVSFPTFNALNSLSFRPY